MTGCVFSVLALDNYVSCYHCDFWITTFRATVQTGLGQIEPRSQLFRASLYGLLDKLEEAYLS